MIKYILVGALLAPVASATFVYGPHGAMDITPLGNDGYAITSLSGGGITTVTRTPSGVIITPPDEPATFIDYEKGGGVGGPVLPMIPITPNVGTLPEYSF